MIPQSSEYLEKLAEAALDTVAKRLRGWGEEDWKKKERAVALIKAVLSKQAEFDWKGKGFIARRNEMIENPSSEEPKPRPQPKAKTLPAPQPKPRPPAQVPPPQPPPRRPVLTLPPNKQPQNKTVARSDSNDY